MCTTHFCPILCKGTDRPIFRLLNRKQFFSKLKCLFMFTGNAGETNSFDIFSLSSCIG